MPRTNNFITNSSLNVCQTQTKLSFHALTGNVFFESYCRCLGKQAWYRSKQVLKIEHGRPIINKLLVVTFLIFDFVRRLLSFHGDQGYHLRKDLWTQYDKKGYQQSSE